MLHFAYFYISDNHLMACANRQLKEIPSILAQFRTFGLDFISAANC
jgi:hypothetical protein